VPYWYIRCYVIYGLPGSGTAAQLPAAIVCSSVLSRHLLFELPEQSTAQQMFSVLCLTASDTAFLWALISFILFCQIDCGWKPHTTWLAHLSRTSCRASLRGLRDPVLNSRKEHVTCLFFNTLTSLPCCLYALLCCAYQSSNFRSDDQFLRTWKPPQLTLFRHICICLFEEAFVRWFKATLCQTMHSIVLWISTDG